MAKHSAKAAPAKGAGREVLDYRHLEDELHDAVNMSKLACDQIERLQDPSSRTSSGGYLLSKHEMNLLSFSVYHANKLVKDMERKWGEVHDDNLAARQKGGDA